MSTQWTTLHGGPSILAGQTVKSDGWQDDPFEDQMKHDVSSDTPDASGARTRVASNLLSQELNLSETVGTSFSAALPLWAPKYPLTREGSFLAIQSPGQNDFYPLFLLQGQINNLRHFYALLSDDEHIGAAFQDVPALFSLLKAAIQPLRSTFGNDGLFQLEALESDEGTILRVIAKLPHDAGNAAELMGRFNSDWWVNNCARSKASLVFDYEIGDGV